MRISTKGLILTEQSLGETDKIVTILTESNGIMRCFAKNAKNIKSSTCTGSQSLCYSRLSIYMGRDKYILDNAEPLSVFYELRSDIEKLALAQYFCELLINIVPEDSEPNPYLRLALNSLYFIAHDKRPRPLVKAVFELRLLSLAGFMPNLVCCDECKIYESDIMYFSCREGTLLCEGCYNGKGGYIPLHRGALTSMRHSIYADFEKIFSFNVTGNSLTEFSNAAERYLLYTVGKSFASLDFYNTIADSARARQ